MSGDELLRELSRDLRALEAAGCQFWACEGPERPVEDMETCHVCARIQELRAVLASEVAS